MADRVIGHFPVGVMTVRRGNVYEMPAREITAYDSSAFDAEQRERADAVATVPGCLRGVKYAVALEAAGALFLYGLWMLMHLRR